MMRPAITTDKLEAAPDTAAPATKTGSMHRKIHLRSKQRMIFRERDRRAKKDSEYESPIHGSSLMLPNAS